MFNSLTFKISRLIASIVLLTAIVILAVVWNNLSQTVHKNISSGLKGAQAGFAFTLADYQKNQSEQLALMLENPSYTKALVSSDKTRTAEGLDLINQEINASFSAKLSNKSFGDAVFSEGFKALNDEALNDIFSILASTENSAFFYQIDDSLFWLIATNVAPKNDLLLFGFEFDQTRLRSLSELLGMNMTLSFNRLGDTSSNGPLLVSTTDKALNTQQLQEWELSDNYLNLFNWRVMLGMQAFYTKEAPIESTQNSNAVMYLMINAQRVSDNFVTLQQTIALISLIAGVIAIVLGVYLANRITRPIRQIAQYAGDIAKGDYINSPTFVSYTKEVKQVWQSFEHMQASIRNREHEIKRQARTDSLTTLYNRSFAKRIVDERLQRGEHFQAVGINIYGFRGINDTFGFEFGDECLRRIATRLKHHKGIAARITGGKLIWLPATTQSENDLLELQQELAQDVLLNGISVNLKTAISYFACPEHAQDSEALFRRLNIVFDEAHASKEFLLAFNPAQEERYLRRLTIMSDLKRTLENDGDQLSLVYQPKIELKGTSNIQIEALARWHHPSLGNIAPDEFIAIAEQAGFINLLTRWVIKTSLIDLCQLRREFTGLKLAVNVCADDVLDPNLLSYMQGTVKELGLLPEILMLELTERVIVKKADASIIRLHAIRNAGFKIAIDDFGTGYSSLSYLKQLPIDTLKIDRSFVNQLGDDVKQQAICKTILTLAENFSMDVVAEGIEDEASLDFLTQHGCHWGQGYYICRPMDKRNLTAWLGRNRPANFANRV